MTRVLWWIAAALLLIGCGDGRAGAGLAPSSSAPGPSDRLRPILSDSLARLAGIGLPLAWPIEESVLSIGHHAQADHVRGVVLVDRHWLDHATYDADILAGVLAHEAWHLDRQLGHPCPDGRRDWPGMPGAWAHHAHVLQRLGRPDLAAGIAASAYCVP